MSESLRSPPVWFISCFGLQPETLQEKRNWIIKKDLDRLLNAMLD